MHLFHVGSDDNLIPVIATNWRERDEGKCKGREEGGRERERERNES